MISPRFTAGVPTEEEYLFVGGPLRGRLLTIPVFHWMVFVPSSCPLEPKEEVYRKRTFGHQPEIGPPYIGAFFAIESMDDAQAYAEFLKEVGT